MLSRRHPHGANGANGANGASGGSGGGFGRPSLSTPPRHGGIAHAMGSGRSAAVASSSGGGKSAAPPRHSTRGPPKSMMARPTPSAGTQTAKKRARRGLELVALARVELAGFAVSSLVFGSIIDRMLSSSSFLSAVSATLVHIALALMRHTFVCAVRDDRLAAAPFALRSSAGMIHVHAAHALAFAILSESMVVGALAGAAYSLSYVLSSRYILPFPCADAGPKRGRFKRIAAALATPATAFRAIALAVGPPLFARAVFMGSEMSTLLAIARAAGVVATTLTIEATYDAFIVDKGPVGKVLPRSMLDCARDSAKDGSDEDAAAVDVLLASLELCEGASIEEAFLALPLEPHAGSPKRRSGLLEFAQTYNNLPGSAADRADAIRRWWHRVIGRVSSTSSARLRDVLLLASSMRFKEVTQAVYTADAAQPGKAFVGRQKLTTSLEIIRARAFMELASISASTSPAAKRARRALFSGVDQWGSMHFLRLASACTSAADAMALALEAYVEMRAVKPTTLPDAKKVLLGPRPAEARNMTDAEKASVSWAAMRKAREAKTRPWVGAEWWRGVLRGPFEPIDPVREQRADEADGKTGRVEAALLKVGRRPYARQAEAILADAPVVAHAAAAMASMVKRSASGEDDHRVAADAIPAILQSLLRLHVALDAFDAKLTSKMWGMSYPSLKNARGKSAKRTRKLKRIALPPSGMQLMDVIDGAIEQICSCIVTDADGIDVIRFSDPILDDCFAQFQASLQK